jgi:hypothetical protein
MSQFELWENVQVLSKIGKSASETFQMIKQAYSEHGLDCSAVFMWHIVHTSFLESHSAGSEVEMGCT